MKRFKFKIVGTVTDLETNVETVSQTLEFEGSAPSIHHAIQNMSPSFTYGMGVSLSKELTPETKKPEGHKLEGPPK